MSGDGPAAHHLPGAVLVVRDGIVLDASPAAVDLLGDQVGTTLDAALHDPRRSLDGGELHLETTQTTIGDATLVAIVDRTRETQLEHALEALGELTVTVAAGVAERLDRRGGAPGPTAPSAGAEALLAPLLHPDDLPDAIDLLGRVATDGRRRDRTYRVDPRALTGAPDDPTAPRRWAAGELVVSGRAGSRDRLLVHVRLLDPEAPPAVDRLAGLSLMESSPVAVLLCQADGSTLFASPEARRLLGDLDTSLAANWVSAVEPEHHEALLTNLRDTRAGADAAAEVRPIVVALTQRRNNRLVWVRARFAAAAPSPNVSAVSVVLEDVTDLVELQSAQDRLARMLDMTSDLLVAVADPSGYLLYRNEALGALLPDRPWGKGSITEIIRDDDPVEVMLDLWEALSTGGEWHREVTLGNDEVTMRVAAVGTAERDSDGEIVAYLLTAHDVTRLKEVEADLRRLATHDALTGLPNRALLRTVMDEWRLDPTAGDVAALYIDLNGFKEINDEAGHAVGDAVLVEVAHRLRASIDATHLVVRLGGDEFVILLRNTDDDEAAATAKKVAAAVAVPIDVDGVAHEVTAAIGVAVAPVRELDDSLVRAADGAMYADKHDGGRERR